MRLDNQTPAQAIAFRQFARDGGLDCVVAVRASFEHRQDGVLKPAPNPAPFQYEDVYEGDPHASVLLRQSDLVPEKPGTDVTFLGSSFAPNGAPAREWPAEIRVGDRLRKRLLVTGPRQWLPQTKLTWSGLFARDPKRLLTGWTLSEPEPVGQVELTWAKAFGGPVMGTEAEDSPADVHRENPLGPGLLDFSYGDPEAALAAHQIDNPDNPVRDWEQHDRSPQGFGPISPWWRQRQQFAGTYDDTWLEERHPLLPEDFDPRFWQCAHPDLIATPHLQGDEEYELVNLHREHKAARGRLPGIRLGAHCEGADEGSAGWHMLTLDGVHFDFRDGRDLAMLTWRTRFPLNQAERAVLTLKRIRLANDSSVAREAAE
ncbi:DUF2169 family type VI secretion system accessory protein [Sinorhizobium americanum]|uniref:Exported protein n=1 Tax=Sinorhizobium americanum TaxID=194963 RepID=A0A1L3LZT6_9HYPH|nr:DUF2169 domain-containing protein [Sinorhizobium americanum]APG95602.1 exported protein [Sinorhizobium americanum]OAP46080.1 hypothetical protein ATC00_03310 [Sinorhizobium americanum]